MKNRTRKQILILAVVLSISGTAAIYRWRAVGSIPSLDEIRGLARGKQFDRARSLLERYLEHHPENARARLLMADLATEPTNVHPALALEHLRAIRPANRQQAARVKFFEGKAHYQQGRYDLAETSWKAALELDSLVPEAGWALVGLLDMESRTAEAHELGMRLHESEPDPRDRVRILLEMSRLDIESPSPLSQVGSFEPLVKEHPENLPVALALGSALIRINRGDDGLAVLQDVLRRHPDSAVAWDVWLIGLGESGDFEKLTREFSRLPRSLAPDPRFAKHEGMIAQNARDWPTAVRAYRRALAFEPYNKGVLYRLGWVLRPAGEPSESNRINREFQAYQRAFDQLRGSFSDNTDCPEDLQILEKDLARTRGAYLEMVAIKTLGLKPYPVLYQRMADLREKMFRIDEARAWHRLVVRDFPANAFSLAALDRLK